MGNVTVRGEKDGKGKAEARRRGVCLSMYSITENIYYSQLSSVSLLLQPERNCFTSYNIRKGMCSLSLCAIVLRFTPPSHLSTCNGQRSWQLFCVHYTTIVSQRLRRYSLRPPNHSVVTDSMPQICILRHIETFLYVERTKIKINCASRYEDAAYNILQYIYKPSSLLSVKATVEECRKSAVYSSAILSQGCPKHFHV
jgi:hypothetical protein